MVYDEPMTTSVLTRTVAKAAAGTIMCDLYLRLSDGRNENGSFQAREATLRARATQLGWTVYRVVIENDLTPGASRNASAFKRRKITLPDGTKALRVVRPGFRSMLEDLANGQVQAVLAEDLDRTLRDHRDAQDLIDVIREHKANARSLSGSLTLTDGGTDAEIMMLEMMVTVAKKASADTARRVTEGRGRQAAIGQWGGGRRPYGFTPVPHPAGNHQNTELEICEPEAEEIRAAAASVLTGVSLRSLAKGLRDRGVPTVTGTRWTAETLHTILLRPINAGIVMYQGEETDVRLPGDPIISEETFRAVVTRLIGSERKHPGYAPESAPGRAPKWLGSGLYFCLCGSTMEISGSQSREHAYRCAHDGRETGTEHVRRNARQLDAYIREVVIKRLSRPDAIRLVKSPDSTVDTKALSAEAVVLREQLSEFARDRADGLISRAQMLAGTERVNAKLAVIESRLASATNRSPLTPLVNATDVAQAWDELSLGERRAVIRELITITVLPVFTRSHRFDHTAIRIVPVTPDE
jgi:DNA invertase Pin-like site-specific DNA recombinase